MAKNNIRKHGRILSIIRGNVKETQSIVWRRTGEKKKVMKRGRRKKERRERILRNIRKTEEEMEDDKRKKRMLHERGEYKKGEAEIRG